MIDCVIRWIVAPPIRLRATLVIGLLCLSLSAHGAAGAQVIGRVKVTEGEVFIISGGVSTRARPGSLVKAADTLITGSSGSIGVTLYDDTRISLGPTSGLELKAFEFQPLRDKHLFTGRLDRGSMLYESRWAGKTASIETPNATIGIRGTRFLIRVEND